MKRRFRILSVLFTFMLLALSLTVSAHEGREIGDYVINVGWREEPAYTNLMNGPEITISRQSAGDEQEATPEAGATGAAPAVSNGVIGLEDTLQIEVSFGPASKTFQLRAVGDEPGHYTADLIPTRPGDYVFRVFGTIEGTDVDETFSASEGQFSTIEPIEDIQFP